MTGERREDLIVILGAVLVIVSVVAFASAMLSPMLAAFVGGLGTGVGGVLALQRGQASR
jgi:hypothetical protein